MIHNTPYLSIVVPAFNEEKQIECCLQALSKQKTSFPYEIIVVDNNSSDQTLALARKFDVRIVKEKRVGVAYARQAGFDCAKGEIVVSTDADTQAPEDWLKRIDDLMKGDRVIGVSGPFLFYDRGKVWNGLAKIITPIIVALDKILGKGQNHFNGMNFAIRKSTFEKCGGFNNHLQFGEDIDLAKRTRKYGRIIFKKDLLVYTNSRRFKISRDFARYLLNFLKSGLTGKPFRNELPRVQRRKDVS